METHVGPSFIRYFWQALAFWLTGGVAKSHESRQFCLRGFFYFHPGFGKGARCCCPEDSRGPICRAWAKLAQKAGAGFIVPWKKRKGKRDFGWNIFSFIWIFFLYFVSTLAAEGIYLKWKDDQGVRRVMAQRVRRAIPPKKFLQVCCAWMLCCAVTWLNDTHTHTDTHSRRKFLSSFWHTEGRFHVWRVFGPVLRTVALVCPTNRPSERHWERDHISHWLCFLD